MQTHITTELPSAEGFIALRRETNWGEISLNQAATSLSASLGGVSLYASDVQTGNDTTLIGMARVIGDGVLNIYVQDVIIAKGYRGQGHGAKLLATLITALKQSYPADCTIGLMAAKGQAPFYARFGFLPRPCAATDAGMNAPLGQLA